MSRITALGICILLKNNVFLLCLARGSARGAVPHAAPCSHRAPTPHPLSRPQTGKKYNYLQLKAMFRLADLDNSGSIDFNEFLHAQRRAEEDLEP